MLVWSQVVPAAHRLFFETSNWNGGIDTRLWQYRLIIASAALRTLHWDIAGGAIHFFIQSAD